MADPTLQLPPLVELVRDNGFLDDAQAQELIRQHLESGKPYKQLILDQGTLSEEDLLTLMAGNQGTDVVDLSGMEFDDTLKNLIPVASVRIHSIVPVEAEADHVTFATADLVETDVIDELTFLLSKEIRFVFATEAQIKAAIDANFAAGDASDALLEELPAVDDATDEKGIESAAASAPVIRFVNLVLYQAITDRASDIHIEPFEKDFKIRYRVDGALYEMNPPPLSMALPIISRIKVLSNLNIAERRVPQDGRIALTVAGRQVDLRVSCLPTVHGESVARSTPASAPSTRSTSKSSPPKSLWNTTSKVSSRFPSTPSRATPSPKCSAPSSVKTPTSSWSAKSATWRPPKSPSRPPSPATSSSPPCTPTTPPAPSPASWT